MNLDYKVTYFKGNSITNDSHDTQYRKDIIHIFNLNHFFKQDKIDDRLFFKSLSDNVHTIYLKYKNHSQILNVLNKIKDNLKMPFELTNDMLFMHLFRFDLFYLFHKCLIDLEKNNNITEPNFKLLINSI
jgi:hypothetical protein